MFDFTAIEIEINTSCNQRCSYCPNGQYGSLPPQEMEEEVFSRLIAELKEHDFRGRISFDFYNEPLLCSKLDSFVGHIARELAQATMVLYTNGTLLSQKRYQTLRSLGVKQFIVTRHEGIPSSSFLTWKNEQHSDVLLREFEDIQLTNRGGSLTQGVACAAPVTYLRPCHIPEHIVTIDVQGQVLPCFEDYHRKNVMGSLKEQSLWQIWHSERYQDFRRRLRLCQNHLFDPCKNCNRREVLPPFSWSL